MNCVKYVYLYCRGMDLQFIGGFLFFDKYVKDVFFFDKYVFERWEVGCFVFCDFMIFGQKYYYLVVCLIIILRVICFIFINFYNLFFLYNQFKFIDMFQFFVLIFQCVFYFMVGFIEGIEGVSKDIIDVLFNVGFMIM